MSIDYAALRKHVRMIRISNQRDTNSDSTSSYITPTVTITNPVLKTRALERGRVSTFLRNSISKKMTVYDIPEQVEGKPDPFPPGMPVGADKEPAFSRFILSNGLVALRLQPKTVLYHGSQKLYATIGNMRMYWEVIDQYLEMIRRHRPVSVDDSNLQQMFEDALIKYIVGEYCTRQPRASGDGAMTDHIVVMYVVRHLVAAGVVFRAADLLEYAVEQYIGNKTDETAKGQRRTMQQVIAMARTLDTCASAKEFDVREPLRITSFRVPMLFVTTFDKAAYYTTAVVGWKQKRTNSQMFRYETDADIPLVFLDLHDASVNRTLRESNGPFASGASFEPELVQHHAEMTSEELRCKILQEYQWEYCCPEQTSIKEEDFSRVRLGVEVILSLVDEPTGPRPHLRDPHDDEKDLPLHMYPLHQRNKPTTITDPDRVHALLRILVLQFQTHYPTWWVELQRCRVTTPDVSNRDISAVSYWTDVLYNAVSVEPYSSGPSGNSSETKSLKYKFRSIDDFTEVAVAEYLSNILLSRCLQDKRNRLVRMVDRTTKKECGLIGFILACGQHFRPREPAYACLLERLRSDIDFPTNGTGFYDKYSKSLQIEHEIARRWNDWFEIDLVSPYGMWTVLHWEQLVLQKSEFHRRSTFHTDALVVLAFYQWPDREKLGVVGWHSNTSSEWTLCDPLRYGRLTKCTPDYDDTKSGPCDPRPT